MARLNAASADHVRGGLGETSSPRPP